MFVAIQPSVRSAGRTLTFAIACLLAAPILPSVVRDDRFEIRSSSGETAELDAVQIGAGQGAVALELNDGQVMLVPEPAVLSREAADPPVPLTANEMAAKLADLFGSSRIVTYVADPYVVGLVLANPTVDERERARKIGNLKQAGRFLRSVQGKFLGFIRDTRVAAQPLKYPLVALIFESDVHFDDYARIVTGNRGLSAGAIAGFSDSLSNHLVLRIGECRTFDVPLHEAIHQQVYNRLRLQRLAPIPVWFNEGLAAGFEGDGRSVQHGPQTVSRRYARLALGARRVDWREVVRNDRTFHGDVLAGEAYGHAWGLHWLLVTKYKQEYGEYVRHLSQLRPLEEREPDERIEQLETILERSVPALEEEFFTTVTTALDRLR